MADFNTMRAQTVSGTRAAEIDAGLRAHMNKVYGTMSVGMLITAAAAWAISGLATTDPHGRGAIANGNNAERLGAAIYASPLRWVIMFAPLAFILFGWGALMRRASAAGVQLGFFAFAGDWPVAQLDLSGVHHLSITQTFLVTPSPFAGCSLYGYTTKKDLSGMGTFLMMGVIGLIVAMIINIFLQSPAMMFAISAIGILVFAGLTAFHTRR
jgi:uncharacterized protein